MSNLNYESNAKRFLEIREEIKKLNLEAEQIILAHQNEPKPEGRGACVYKYTCGCAEYVPGGSPGVCNRSHCTHYASDHEF